MELNRFIDNLNKSAERANPPETGDYVVDGLLYCKKCGTPKQARIFFNETMRVVACQCTCKAEALRKEQEEFEQKQLRERIKRSRSEALNDKALYSCTFANDDMSNPKLHSALLKYVDNFEIFSKDGKGLLLYGSCGTGKTFAAGCVANALVDKGYSVLMTNFGRIINTVSGLVDNKQKYIDSFCRYKLLVVDDLAAERGTEYAQEIVYNVIDGRYRSGLPMIVTTNLTGEELQRPTEISKQRIYSRLLERCHPIEVLGADRRKVQLKENYGDMKTLLGL